MWHCSSVFLFFPISWVYLLAQVGRLSLQPAPSLSRMAAVAPGHQTLRHNYCITQQSFPPPIPSSTLHLCLFLLLVSPPCSSPSSSDYEDKDWFPAPLPLPASFTLRQLFVVARFDNQTEGWLCLCVSVLLLLCLIVHPALCPSGFSASGRGAEQEKSKVKWIKASFLSALWWDWSLFLAVFVDRDVNIRLNKTTGLDEHINPPTHFSQNSLIMRVVARNTKILFKCNKQ